MKSGPNFNLLQNFRSEAQHIHYFVFDILICQDRDLTKLPLSERRLLMKSHLKLRPREEARSLKREVGSEFHDIRLQI